MAYNEWGEWEDDYERIEVPGYDPGEPSTTEYNPLVEDQRPQGDEGQEYFRDLDERPQAENTDWDAFSDEGHAEDWLESISAQYGVPIGETDLENLRGKAPEDFEQYQRDLEQQYARRAEDDDDQPSQQQAGPSRSSGGSSRSYTPYRGQAVEVGTDPFSQLISGGYADLLSRRGQTPFGSEIEGYISGLLGRGGEIDEDPSLMAQRMEAARQPIEAFRRMQTNQGRAELANRGLISEPGQPQGVEASFLANLDEELAPWYASAGQNLASELARDRSQRFDRALTLGTGFASQQASDYLNALRGATDRQATLADIALGTLDRNMTWNRFLAEYGLSRDEMLEAIQSGRQDDVNQMLELFQDYVNASREGYR